MTVTTRGACRVSLSGCRSCCRTTVGLSGSVGLLSEVTVGLSDRGSVRGYLGIIVRRLVEAVQTSECLVELAIPHVLVTSEHRGDALLAAR